MLPLLVTGGQCRVISLRNGPLAAICVCECPVHASKAGNSQTAAMCGGTLPSTEGRLDRQVARPPRRRPTSRASEALTKRPAFGKVCLS